MPETVFKINRDAQRYVLGSGKNFITPWQDEYIDKTPDELHEIIFQPENQWGYTKNGATLTITPTTYNVKDDLGEIDDTILTSEAATLQVGQMTIGPDILMPLIETSKAVVSTVKGREIVQMGGIANANNMKWLLGFQHIDNNKGDTHLICCGKNTSEMSFPFQPENEMILTPTFSLSPINREGGKVYWETDNKDEMETGEYDG